MADLRPPRQVMRRRMGAFHQSRLSFMRALLRRLKSEGWHIDRPVFEIDRRGVVWRLTVPVGRIYIHARRLRA